VKTRAIVLVLAAACAGEPTTATAPASVAVELPAAIRPIPADRDGVLHELAPLPSPSIVVVYDVTGPAGLAGSLEVLAAPGGRRRENWALRLPVDGRDHDLRGSKVRTPDVVWQAPDGETGRLVPARLGAIADAIVDLDPTTRTKVIELVRAWRSELELARVEHPGSVETIAGEQCVRVPVGTGEVCTWEATGLPLRWVGSGSNGQPGFSLVARHIDRSAVLGASAFEIPLGAERIAAPPFDVLDRVAAVARGDRSAIADLVLADELPGLAR
jgi:hypothetical protein